MKKILVIATGGTIGSSIHLNKINVSVDGVSLLTQLYNKSQLKNTVDFEAETLFNKHSENIFPSDWELICSKIKTLDLSAFCGIIITCGTDTLAYTASALGLALGYLPIPIMIVSADYPLEDKKSNGPDNFCGAVDFILNEKINGVFVVYAQKGSCFIHLATRINQCTSFTDLIESIDGKPFGVMENNKFLRLDNRAFNISPNPYKNVDFKISNSIFCIWSYPSLDYRVFNIETAKPQAIVHMLYHSATACVTGEYNSLVSFAQRCKQLDIPLYIAPYPIGRSRYVSDCEIVNAGAVPLCDMGAAAAVVKVMIAYGTFADKTSVNAFLENTVFCERI